MTPEDYLKLATNLERKAKALRDKAETLIERQERAKRMVERGRAKVATFKAKRVNPIKAKAKALVARGRLLVERFKAKLKRDPLMRFSIGPTCYMIGKSSIEYLHEPGDKPFKRRSKKAKPIRHDMDTRGMTKKQIREEFVFHPDAGYPRRVFKDDNAEARWMEKNETRENNRAGFKYST